MTVDLAVIGGGNMGAALVGGLLESGTYDAERISVVEVSEERRTQLRQRFSTIAVYETVPQCSGAIVAVKPDAAVAAAASAAAAGATRLLSIAAGVRLDALQQAVGDIAVIRAMPNTPALVRSGTAAIAGGPTVTEADYLWAESILSAVGTVDRLPEPLLDAFTGVAGSGPAYVFVVAEALIDAAVAEGIPRDVATRVVTQLLVGSAALLAREGDPAALRRAVTSPGGTTAAGLEVLDREDLRGTFAAAVAAATERSRQLG